MVIYAEPQCPACGARFVLTTQEPPPKRPSLPLHFYTVQINQGGRGQPQYRQGDKACPMSGAFLDDLAT